MKRIKQLIKTIIYQVKAIPLRIRLIKKHDCILVQTPFHSNIGDSQIALAERMFLKKHDISYVEITYDEYWNNRSFLLKIQNRFTFLAIHGGGNIGNEYMNEEKTRRDILTSFSGKKMIIFPQTIFFTNNEIGEREKYNTISIYNSIPNLCICLRDYFSFNFAKTNFKCKTYFVPDIVLSVPKSKTNVHKNGKVLFVLRNDNEKVAKDDQIERVKELLNSMNLQYDVTDMVSKSIISKKKRNKVCKAKIDQISNYSLVITDRLHGMVFSYLASTPCVALDNYNGKVFGTYSWIKKSRSICYVKSIEEINQEIISEQILKQNDEFTFDVSNYDELVFLLNEMKRV